ncbi:hypothetical protein SRB5_31720 [Streptomyces sp. RB5]|uniref:Uncharacterized protein n=1 Tax=Streptomyces smaragdinus TaxID=2585196 RepID=A0A7K0CJ35_9ACTN|nr:hypothetical protein [Streptomyces smaragdinus]MQY13032.1 hypothetical protein [Streptomyces smaragdinus]
MTTATIHPAPTYDSAQPLPPVAARLLRHRAGSALRAVKAFGGAALSVVLLGEYTEGAPPKEPH